MAKAKVTLTDQGPITYSGHGRNLARGQSFVTTNESEILTFQAEHGFNVEMLEGKAPRAAATLEPDETDRDFDHGDGPKPAKKPKKAAKPAPEEEPDEDEEPEEPEEPAEPTPADGKLTEDELKKHTKASLRELAEERGVEVDANANKDALVAALLKAQEGEGGDDDEADDEDEG